jgi:two-component system chemotaxis response regulator CheB
MGSATSIPVAEAAKGDEILKNKIYLAPGGYHMKIVNQGAKRGIALDQGPEENYCRPAVDPLFRSAAEIYGPGVLGVVLTGMGQDGMVGSEAIRLRGGQILAQDEKSSAVWGMPGAVVTANLANGVYPLSEIGTEVLLRSKMIRR